MPRAPFDPAFLARIGFVQAALSFEAITALELPPFGGSALRGAFGWAFRRGLCTAKPPCEKDCADPARCPYFLLFEKTQNERGDNIPKPYILDPPVPPQLEQIAAGAPVRFPYKLRNADVVGTQGAPVPKGALFSVRFTVLGQTIPLLTPVVNLLASQTLFIGGGQAQLVRAEDLGPGNRTLYDRAIRNCGIQPPIRQTLEHALRHPTPARVRVLFRTPTRLRAAGGSYCFDAAELANHFWQSILTRVSRIHDMFCAVSGAERLPFYELRACLPPLAEARIFRYRLTRFSNRQESFMDFDGVIGSLEYSGDFSVVKSLLVAAETLRIGQKATFGFGRVTCWFQDVG